MLLNYVSDDDFQHLPLFADLDTDTILPYLRLVRYPKGKYLYHAGDKPDSIYVLLAGFVKLTHSSPNGDEKVISIYERGGIFGELCLGKYRQHLGTAVALSDITVARMSERHLHSLIQRFPDLAMNFIRHLADEQRETLARMHTLMHLDAQHRLLGTLTYMARHYCCRSGEWTRLPSCITQEDIASIACVNRSTASLHINDLRRKGVLGGKGRTLTINRPAIEKLLQDAGLEILE
ncbi:MAG: Crp/Fnr family transcriptional regulator [Anaerolineae bacterium]